jgi:hypothetical protein
LNYNDNRLLRLMFILLYVPVFALRQVMSAG